MFFLPKMIFLCFTTAFMYFFLKKEQPGDLAFENCRIKNGSRFGVQKFINLLPEFSSQWGCTPTRLNRSIPNLMNFG
jgi:hypothetical protein